MNQTLLALAGLTLAIYMALSVQRSRIHLGEVEQLSEVETAAGNVALDALAHIAVQQFDAATAGGTVTDPSQLTPQPFATGNRWQDAADVDDFHRVQTHTMTGAYDALPFTVDVSVRYVTEATTPSATQTYYKEVSVRVFNPALRDTVRMAQVVSFP